MPKVRALLNQRASRSIVGRDEEITHLLETFSQKTPLVVHLHGIAGIGKSTLLEVLVTRAQEKKIRIVRLDCRLMEPTERGFLHQLGVALGQKAMTLEKASAQITRLGWRIVLALDNYEVFRLMDAWLRQVFVPALGTNADMTSAVNGGDLSFSLFSSLESEEMEPVMTTVDHADIRGLATTLLVSVGRLSRI